MINPRFLNAEDDTTLAETEIAVDVATLDRTTEIAVMRGVAVDNEKYRGKRIFGAGINLTHLYLGKIPYLWFLIRDLGYVHKLLRGVATPESVPDDVNGRGIEKLWIAALDTFAIGGHCQALVVHGLRSGRVGRLRVVARAQGRDHSGLRELAPAALRRRSDDATGHPLRAQAQVRQPGGAADLRRDRAAWPGWTQRSIASLTG